MKQWPDELSSSPLLLNACFHNNLLMSWVHACLTLCERAWRVYALSLVLRRRNHISSFRPLSPILSVIPISVICERVGIKIIIFRKWNKGVVKSVYSTFNSFDNTKIFLFNITRPDSHLKVRATLKGFGLWTQINWHQGNAATYSWAETGLTPFMSARM